MRPDQRASRTRGFPSEQFERGNVVCVPDLLGNQTATFGGKLHDPEQGFGGLGTSCRQLVMGALARQQRPGPSDAGSVEGRAIFVLAVAVTVVAIPARALRQVH